LDIADRGTPAGLNNLGITLPQHFKAHDYVLHSIDKVYHNKGDDAAVWDDLIKEQNPRVTSLLSKSG